MRHERPLLGSERVESATCRPADVRDQRFTVGRRSHPTGQTPRRPRTRWLCSLIALWCSSPLSFGLEHHDTDFGRSGQFELQAKALRMQRVRLQLPDMKLVDYTGSDQERSCRQSGQRGLSLRCGPDAGTPGPPPPARAYALRYPVLLLRGRPGDGDSFADPHSTQSGTPFPTGRQDRGSHSLVSSGVGNRSREQGRSPLPR